MSITSDVIHVKQFFFFFILLRDRSTAKLRATASRNVLQKLAAVSVRLQTTSPYSHEEMLRFAIHPVKNKRPTSTPCTKITQISKFTNLTRILTIVKVANADRNGGIRHSALHYFNNEANKRGCLRAHQIVELKLKRHYSANYMREQTAFANITKKQFHSTRKPSSAEQRFAGGAVPAWRCSTSGHERALQGLSFHSFGVINGRICDTAYLFAP